MTEESEETKVVKGATLIVVEHHRGVDPPPIEELLFTLGDDPTTYTGKQLEEQFGYRVKIDPWRRVPEDNAFDLAERVGRSPEELIQLFQDACLPGYLEWNDIDGSVRTEVTLYGTGRDDNEDTKDD